MKSALIMEGGAMRGMFTCGVIDVLMERGIEFDAAAGISAGAVFGCNFKSRQIGRPIRYNKQYCRDPRYCSFRSLVKTGNLFGADFCYRELPDELDPFDYETYRENPMPFYAGAADIRTGEILYRDCKTGTGDDMEWLRASASMPLVSTPVSVDGRLLLDGGIVEALPYAYMLGLGYDRNVLVMTQPKGYRKEKGNNLSLIRIMYRKYPKIVEAMSLRHERYNRLMDRIDRDEADGKILVIRPEGPLGMKRVEKDPEVLERAYRMGREVMERRMNELWDYLKNG